METSLIVLNLLLTIGEIHILCFDDCVEIFAFWTHHVLRFLIILSVQYFQTIKDVSCTEWINIVGFLFIL